MRSLGDAVARAAGRPARFPFQEPVLRLPAGPRPVVVPLPDPTLFRRAARRRTLRAALAEVERRAADAPGDRVPDDPRLDEVLWELDEARDDPFLGPAVAALDEAGRRRWASVGRELARLDRDQRWSPRHRTDARSSTLVALLTAGVRDPAKNLVASYALRGGYAARRLLDRTVTPKDFGRFHTEARQSIACGSFTGYSLATNLMYWAGLTGRLFGPEEAARIGRLALRPGAGESDVVAALLVYVARFRDTLDGSATA